LPSLVQGPIGVGESPRPCVVTEVRAGPNRLAMPQLQTHTPVSVSGEHVMVIHDRVGSAPRSHSGRVGSVIPEPEEPSVVGLPPLFLRTDELVHSKVHMLQHRVLVHILEIHDFSQVDSSDDEPRDSSSKDSDANSLPPQ
jgi:hypothetical protein